MLHVQTDVAAFEAEVQQEFERREELLKKVHEAEAGVKVEPTTKTEINSAPHRGADGDACGREAVSKQT